MIEIGKFTENIAEATLNMPNTLDIIVDDLTNRIYNAAFENVTMSSGKRVCIKRTSWWNVDCSRMVADRRRARKKLEKHPMKNNLDDYNQKIAAAKEMYEKSKKSSFQLYVSTLQHDTPIKTVWKKNQMIQIKLHATNLSFDKK